MQKQKILLVEDELTLRETIEEILELNNYEVETASNGENAFKILENWQPDIIISDVMMPVMSGFELIQRIKLIDHLKNIPIIFLSALVAKNEIKKGMNLGARAFLTKPFIIADLLKLIKKHIL
jgi:two-component system sensor kinase